MTPEEPRRSEFPWLEVTFLTLFGTGALVWQLFPAVISSPLTWLDVRGWTRPIWFFANSVFLSALLAVRFGPDIIREWVERRERLARKQIQAMERKKLAEQRESLERLKAARKRRIY